MLEGWNASSNAWCSAWQMDGGQQVCELPLFQCKVNMTLGVETISEKIGLRLSLVFDSSPDTPKFLACLRII